MYVIGALAALVMPVTWAVKVMAISMLLLLPAGLAVLFHGMKKSRLLGLLGLAPVLGATHWGLRFVGAIGLFAMAVGCALLVLDEPTRRRQVYLALALAAVFFDARLPVPVRDCGGRRCGRDHVPGHAPHPSDRPAARTLARPLRGLDHRAPQAQDGPRSGRVRLPPRAAQRTP